MQNPFLTELTYFLGNAYPPFVYKPNPSPISGYIPVFISHKVEKDEFEEKLAYLKQNNYSTCKADELLGFLQGKSGPAAPTICLTFDDVHKSLYDTAFPLLKKYKFTAIAFVVPSFMDKPNWVTWEMATEMNKSGIIDIQSHTMEHKWIPGMVEDEVLCELTQSKKILEDKLNKPIQHLAYPYGTGSNLSCKISKKAGYLTNFWGPVYSAPYNKSGTDPYKIARLKDDYILRLPGEKRKTLKGIFADKIKRRVSARIKGKGIYQ